MSTTSWGQSSPDLRENWIYRCERPQLLYTVKRRVLEYRNRLNTVRWAFRIVGVTGWMDLVLIGEKGMLDSTTQ